ncbi:glycosyltransferase family 2 protein [Pedobacter changchengzhani]|uniref:Glycosyltransferase family 2 protein n=1 Tax=Pedobacter changchengzhani TaxID=2529274 RepID=A0A4R5MIC1_9SPHI|nr:glycosyltransferase family 2 protein [Pedobacter changchengzhani]TDG35294.1 glycosyltransferase family 2 protein [Pedobacter changchengzhani]
MTLPLISVIIPLYNSEKHIAETLNSIYNQTYTNIEVIVIDDGSTDNSYEVANKLKKENTIIVRQNNKGASAARNAGSKIAKGKYIQFLDADDLISDDKIASQALILEERLEFISICSTVYFKDGEEINLKYPEKTWMSNFTGSKHEFIRNLYGGDLVGANLGGMVAVHSWLSPKIVLDKAGQWNEALSMDDDGEYFCRVLLASEGICFSVNGINYYRKHNSNTNLSAQLTLKGFTSMFNASLLKYSHLKDELSKDLLDKIFSIEFQQITVATYPRFNGISAQALKKTKEFGLKKIAYSAGPISTILSKIFGWKLIKYINYLRFGH